MGGETEAHDPARAPTMPLIARILSVLVLAAAVATAAFLAIVLAALAAAALLVAFVLHKLGWDRRLIAHLARRSGVRVATFRFDEREGPARPDAPIEARWTLVEERRPG